MSDEGKFWLGLNSVVAVTVMVIVFLSLSYWKDHNAKIVKMVESGVDPIAVICALQDDYGTAPVCLVLATKKG